MIRWGQKQVNPLRCLNLAVFMRGQVFLLPVLYIFYQKNGLSLSDFFYFQGIVTFISLLFYVPAGYLADIFSKKKILILSMLFALTRAVLWLLFSGYWIVLIGEISYALSRSFFSGIVDSYMCDYLKTLDRQDKMTKCYGRLNFFMSLSSALSALIGPFMLVDFSLAYLIVLEAVFILMAIYFLCRLPEVPVFNKGRGNLMQKYHHIYNVLKVVFHKNHLWVPMFYSGLFSATTILLVWCFQPLMLKSLIPVVCFGIISFINHITRASFSIHIQKIMNLFSLQKIQNMACFLFVSSILGLSLSFWVANMTLSIVCLLLSCLATGMQLAYTVAAIAYVHSQIKSGNRSLISNLNFMIAAVLSSVLLFIFKSSLQFVSIEISLMAYTLLFCACIAFLQKNQ